MLRLAGFYLHPALPGSSENSQGQGPPAEDSNLPSLTSTLGLIFVFLGACGKIADLLWASGNEKVGLGVLHALVLKATLSRHSCFQCGWANQGTESISGASPVFAGSFLWTNGQRPLKRGLAPRPRRAFFYGPVVMSPLLRWPCPFPSAPWEG